MIQLKVTLANGETLELSGDNTTELRYAHQIQTIQETRAMMDPYDSDCWIRVDEPYIKYAETCSEEEDENPTPFSEFDIDYYRIRHAEWEVYGNHDNFEEYVCSWMNDNPESLKDVITHGCINGAVPELIYHKQVMDCLVKYKNEIQHKAQEIVDDTGDANFLFDPNNGGFSIDKLVWMCFEETVRNALAQFDLEDA